MWKSKEDRIVFEVVFSCENCSCKWSDGFTKETYVYDGSILNHKKKDIGYKCPNCECVNTFKVIERKRVRQISDDVNIDERR